MMNRFLAIIMGVLVVGAMIVGIIYRSTYTNITEEPDFMEKYFSVALYDFDMSPQLFERMGEELPNSPIIVRVKSDGTRDFEFKSIKQNVEVLEVYRGDELTVGDEIAVRMRGGFLVFENMSANVHFVNFMQDGDEYLLFLEGKFESPDPKEDNHYIFSDLIIPGIFNYEDKDHTIIETSQGDRYVPYKEVKDNEFFVSSEEVLDELMKLKHDLLKQYP